jgi:cytochrome c553
MNDQKNIKRHVSRRPLTWLAGLGCLGLSAALIFPALNAGESTPTRITPAADKAKADQPISFNRDIRPILSDKCFACHGPDAKVAEGAGGFRLDIREGAIAPAEASGKLPIVPGDAEASEVILRIQSTKPNVIMPPPATHTTITDDELALLTRWINEGAKYEGHWAYQVPTKPAAPQLSKASEKWAKNEIDRFIASRLEKLGMSPSPEADKTTLIRRVTLDLTGLPPTPEEIDAFLADDSPGAYANLLDRLMQSPHFGERLALLWLDAARYGDTNGYHHDNIRTAWPWRQWVIEAFNANMPYDQFIIEQLAGDLLPDATQDQILASGFCRMHNINDEGGALNQEYLVEAHADRIETIATVFMAQTFNCARCHDHKYDPTTQDDYYSLVAYFNSVEGERGVYPNNFTAARAYPPLMLYKTDELKEQIGQAEKRLAAAQAEFDQHKPKAEQEIRQWGEQARGANGVSWVKAKLVKANSSHPGTTIELLPDGSARLAGETPDYEDITLTLKTDATNLRLLRLDALTDNSFKDSGIGRSENGNAVLSGIKVRAISTKDPKQQHDVVLNWAWASHEQANADHDIHNALRDDKSGWALGGHEDNHPRTALFHADKPFGFEGGTEIQVTLLHQSQYPKHTLGRVRADVAAANEQVIDVFPTTSSDWFELGRFEGTHPDALKKAFGPEETERITLQQKVIKGQQFRHTPGFIDGKDYDFRAGQHVIYFGRSVFSPVERKVELKLGKGSALQLYVNNQLVHQHDNPKHEKGHDKVTVTFKPGENIIVAKLVKNGPGKIFYQAEHAEGTGLQEMPFALIDPQDRPAFATEQLVNQSLEDSDAAKKVAEVKKQIKQLEDQAVPVLIMKEAGSPVPAYILARGAYNKPVKETTNDAGETVPVPPQKRKPPAMVNLPMPEGAPDNRLGFAQWLIQPEHPLTSRVHVNRLWQMLFGTGIVKSVEDFGSQSEWPSHPALLDYLAVQFVELGWDQKAFIKEIVMSATYRQQATRNAKAQDIDADNRLLSYFPRQRLKGEFIRDQALYVSGLLNDQIGGPSVKPYQPGDLWNEVAIGGTNTGRFKRDTGEALYRRSMYTFWKKTSPPAQMQIFNAPTREFCVVGRDTTNTPLQVLTIWNDEQFLEAARALAQRTIAESDDDKKRLELIYRRCTGEVPNTEELSVLQDVLSYYRERYNAGIEDAKALLAQGEYPLPENYDPAELASWMMVASTALSLDETIVRD